jgi:Fis family transcriptional regulator
MISTKKLCGEETKIISTQTGAPPSLRQSVTEAMQLYFSCLDGQETKDLYQLVMAEVEPPLLRAAMSYTGQNQSKTSELLGLNRGTLRKKLKQHNLL